jgi:autotransporter-associated beta strand protein
VTGVAGSRLGASDFGELVIAQETDAAVGGFGGAGVTNAVIEKQGAGTLTLADTSSFRGLTRIQEGGVTLASGVSHTGSFDVVGGTLTVSGGMSVDTAPVLIGALDVAAITVFILLSGSSNTLPEASNIAFISLNVSSVTSSFLESAVTPLPIRSGVLGIVLITGTSFPSPRQIDAQLTPAAIEINVFPLKSIPLLHISSVSSAKFCGFTERTI